MGSTIKKPIPFYTQKNAPEEWQRRACGIACTQMALGAFKRPVPPIAEMITRGIFKGGYLPGIGWRHWYLASFGGDGSSPKDFKGNVFPEIIQAHADALRGNTIPIVSLTVDTFADTHLVVLSGMRCRLEGTVESFLIHDPSYRTEKEGAYQELPLDEFERRYRRLSIFIQ